MKTEPKNEVAKKHDNLPAEIDGAAWGAETADSKDILIPKLLLAQGLSKIVANEKAQMGDIVDSLTSEIVGSGREKAFKPVPVIPILAYKEWVVYEKMGTDKNGNPKLEFRSIVSHGPENTEWERETETERRDLVLNFFVLRADKADDPGCFPHLLAFRRTSFQAGRKLSTHFTKCSIAAAEGKPRPPAATVFSLTAQKRENDQGTFYVFDVEPAGETKPEHLKRAYQWYQTLRKGLHKVDNRDFEDIGTSSSAAPVVDEGEVDV